jgi:hypothetical protein
MWTLANTARFKLAMVMLVGLVGLQARVPKALACKAAPFPAHVIDPQAAASDTTAPGAPAISVARIVRGKGPDTDYSSCSQSATSCDDMGSIDLRISAQDDQTPTDQLGYQFEVVAGTPPSGLTLPTGPTRLLGSDIYLDWPDGNTDDQESISFSLAIRTVDLAGNLGPATTVQVQHGGSGSGCHLASRPPFSPWPLTTIAILLLGRLLRGCRG